MWVGTISLVLAFIGVLVSLLPPNAPVGWRIAWVVVSGVLTMIGIFLIVRESRARRAAREGATSTFSGSFGKVKLRRVRSAASSVVSGKARDLDAEDIKHDPDRFK